VPTGNSALDVDGDRAVTLAGELVRIPSLYGKEGTAIAERLAEELRDIGAATVLQDVAPDRRNVIGELRFGGGPTLLFEGHMDTKWVDGMTIDPFAGSIRDGRLWGRGSADMKSGLATMLAAMRSLAQRPGEVRGTLRFVSEVGEEGGGWALDPLRKCGALSADAAVVGEPSGLAVEIGNRGWWRGEIKTLGRATHSGTAQEGVNAIRTMARVVLSLYRLPYVNGDDPIWGRSSMNVEHIEGGRWRASVPDECRIRVDSRITARTSPEEADAQITGQLRRLETENETLRVDWEHLEATRNTRSASWIAQDSPIVCTAREAVHNATGADAVLSASTGFTIAAILAEEGTPAIILGPGHIRDAHTVDESVAVEEIRAAARVYTALARRFLAPQVAGGTAAIPGTHPK